MKKFDFKQLIGDIGASLSKHSPEILTGIGIAGMVTTTVLAVKATPKALMLIEAEKERQTGKRYIELGEDATEPVDKLKPKDVIKVTWKCYLPSAITCAASIACLIGASSVHNKRNAVLATAYKISESALTEYREKVVETLGERKEEAIRESIAKDRVENNPPVNQNEIIITEKGSTLCCDGSTGRYFKSDIDKIKKAINEINARLIYDSYVSINEFYEAIGIPGITNGDKLGWNIDKLGKDLLKIHFTPTLYEDTPCVVLDFPIPPYYEYDKFF